jgi:hypothetical protein
MSEPQHVHLGIRAPRTYANRIDRIRAEFAKDLNVKLSRAQAIKMLLDNALPHAEARFGLPPHDEAAA